MMPTGIRSCLLLIMLASYIACAGCSPKAELSGDGESYGCKEPPPDTFTSVGIDAHVAQSTFAKVVTGNVDVKTNPSVVSLASKAARDSRTRDFLRCLALNRDKFTHDQVIYLDNMNAFLATNPTPENFMKWKESYPFPSQAMPKADAGLPSIHPRSAPASEPSISVSGDDNEVSGNVFMRSGQAIEVTEKAERNKIKGNIHYDPTK